MQPLNATMAAPTDKKIQALMARQMGLVSRAQVFELGFSSDYVQWRLRTRQWCTVARGVYGQVPVITSWRQRALAQVLSARPGAVLAYGSAAHVWQLDGFEREPQRIDVASNARLRFGGPAAVWHQMSPFDSRDRTTKNGLPVTTLPRTFIDLATVIEAEHLEVALDSALRRQPKWRQWFLDEVKRIGGRRPGVGTLRQLLERTTPATESALEVRTRQLIGVAGLPVPKQQCRIEDEHGRLIARVDFAWPAVRLIVQAHGYRYHHGRKRFEIDMAQQRELTARNWRILPITWQAIEADAERVIADLRRAYETCAANAAGSPERLPA